MKKSALAHLFTMMFLVTLLSSCNNIDGGYQYRGIYVVEEEKIVDAQDYIIEFPKDGGTIPLSIVGCSDQIYATPKKDWLNIQKDGAAEIFEPESSSGTERYLQKFNIIVEPNASSVSRSSKVLVVCQQYNGFAANLQIKQKH